MATQKAKQYQFSKSFIYQNKKVPWFRGGRRLF